ncbi:MAG: multiprotein-bridging factor 1 family protein [Salibacteraceae bacterium]
MKQKHQAFDRLLEKATPEQERQVSLSLDIVLKIEAILDRRGMSRKELAAAMGKRESEISKWMSGVHNFTLLTLAKLEVVLGEPLLLVSKEREKRD